MHLRARDQEEYPGVARLVAALMCMHVKPVDAELGRVMVPEHASGRSYDFYLEGMCERGKYETQTLIDWWNQGEEWVERNPDHPFAYVMAMALNLDVVDGYVERCAPLVFMRKGKQVGLLPTNATVEQEKKILGSFR